MNIEINENDWELWYFYINGFFFYLRVVFAGDEAREKIIEG